MVVHGLLLPDKIVFSQISLSLTKWQHLEQSRGSYKTPLQENIVTIIVRRTLLKSISVAILTPLASWNYLFSILDVAILLASVRCDIRQSCQGVEDHVQPHYGLSYDLSHNQSP